MRDSVIVMKIPEQIKRNRNQVAMLPCYLLSYATDIITEHQVDRGFESKKTFGLKQDASDT